MTAAATVLPPAWSGLSASAVGVACDIANHVAAVPMLRERIEVLQSALRAAQRANEALAADNAALVAQMRRARGAVGT